MMRGWKYQSHRHSLAARGISSSRYRVQKRSGVVSSSFGWKDGASSPKKYVDENLEGDGSTAEQKLHRFKKGVSETVLHPGKDLDGEWTEYTALADNEYYGPRGKPEKLSKDRFERTQQRGAALVGRVVSQANVEMFVDNEKDRSLHDAAMDFFFGRHT